MKNMIFKRLYNILNCNNQNLARSFQLDGGVSVGPPDRLPPCRKSLLLESKRPPLDPRLSFQRSPEPPEFPLLLSQLPPPCLSLKRDLLLSVDAPLLLSQRFLLRSVSQETPPLVLSKVILPLLDVSVFLPLRFESH